MLNPTSPPRRCRIRISEIVLLVATVLLMAGCQETDSPVPAPKPDDVPNQTSQQAAAPHRKVPRPKTRQVTIGQFTEAARAGDISEIQRGISQDIDVNATDDQGLTALMYAAYNGHQAIIQLLLTNGADINQANELNRTALMMAASGKYPEAVQLLIDAGADVRVRDGAEGWTALMVAAAEGNTQVVQILLDSGANVSAKDVDDETALMFAQNSGHTETAELLAAALEKAEAEAKR